MLKTYLLHIPDQLDQKILAIAKVQNKSKAEIIRQALENGIVAIWQQHTASAAVLLKIAALGTRQHVKGSKDSSRKFDAYLWDRDWSNPEK